MTINAIQGGSSVIAEKVNRRNIKLLEHTLKVYGLDIGHVMAMDYHTSKHPLATTIKEQEINQLKSALPYATTQCITNLSNLYVSIKEHRSANREKSLLDEKRFLKKFDIVRKAIRVTKEKADNWWRTNHARTTSRINCDKGVKAGIEQDVTSEYGTRKINVPPLWFHKVYKHGLQGVEYKGRPCFVLEVSHIPIARLKADDIKIYKATIVSSTKGMLGIHEDMFLASFETSPLHVGVNNNITPAECILSASPELRRAETNVSQRIGRNVLNNLLD